MTTPKDGVAEASAPDVCDTCGKALPEGCSTEFQGDANCALTYGVLGTLTEQPKEPT